MARVECLSPGQCSQKNFTNITALIGYGFRSIIDSSASSFTTFRCDGTSSCIGTKVVSFNKAECRGERACQNVQLSHGKSSVDCNGYQSCYQASIFNVTEAECTGLFSCQSSIITDAETIFGWGQLSLFEATMVSNTKDLRLSLDGSNSVYGATLNCNNNVECTVECDTLDACTNFQCNGNCVGLIQQSEDAMYLQLFNLNVLNSTTECASSRRNLDIHEQLEESANALSVSGTWCCRGESSCDANTIITQATDAKLFCTGQESCPDSSITGMEILYCSGDQSCEYTTLSDNKYMYCLGTKSCYVSNVTATETFLCAGTESCSYAMFDNRNDLPNTQNDMSIYLTGVNSGKDARIVCATGTQCDIFCYGRDSCEDLVLNCQDGSTCNVECDDDTSECPIIVGTELEVECKRPGSCDAVDRKNITWIYASGFNSANNFKVYGVEDVWCDGASSCSNSQVEKYEKAYCRGEESCEFMAFKDGEDDVRCHGYRSCHHATIDTVSKVECTGLFSCREATFTDVKRILAYGQLSLFGASIESNSDAVELTLQGNSAAYGATLNCNNGLECKVRCRTLDACTNFQCTGNCDGWVEQTVDTMYQTFLTLNILNSTQECASASKTVDVYKQLNEEPDVLKPTGTWCCRGADSCSETQMITESEGTKLLCIGQDSCQYPTVHGMDTLYCSGERACDYGQLANNAHLVCLGDRSCEGVNATLTQTFVCAGSKSCQNANFYNHDQDMNLYFMGWESGEETNIHCAKGTTCNIYCGGYDACWKMGLICEDGAVCNYECDHDLSACPSKGSWHIDCYEPNACENKVYDIIEYVWGAGYNSAPGVSVYNTEKIWCEGADSCVNSKFELFGIAYCRGQDSCSSASFKTGTSIVECTAYRSCYKTTISDVLEVDCSGLYGCQEASITDAEIVSAWGQMALFNAKIESKEKAVELTLEASNAAYGAILNCNSEEACTIKCGGLDACTNFQCNGNCQGFVEQTEESMYQALTSLTIPDATTECETASELFDKYEDLDSSDEPEALSPSGTWCCRGGGACDDQEFKSDNANLLCTGWDGCEKSKIHGNNELLCSAEDACEESVLSNNENIYCLGHKSCYRSNVTMTNMILCASSASCQYSRFYNKDEDGAVNDMTIYFTGWESGDSAHIHCASGTECNIFCAGYDSCRSAVLECEEGSVCNFDCDVDMTGCPSGHSVDGGENKSGGGDSSDGSGATIAVVIISVLFVIGIVGLIVWWLRKKKQDQIKVMFKAGDESDDGAVGDENVTMTTS